MGIPSYYRKLKDSVPGLVTKSISATTIVYGLYFDFNCLVYHVLHKKTTPPYPEDAEDDDGIRIRWENALIEEVVKYVHKIVGLVKPSHEVLISVDGVVPFAKMKQQRLRRFKAAATATATATSRSWDKNSITPGTYFMERLGKKLNTLSTKGGCGSDSRGHGKQLKWKVQDASVPGEGEQKIMEFLRGSNNVTGKNIVIYGLDADLIVLSLILRQQRQLNLWLFRENVEFGEMIYDALGEETYVYMDIGVLEKHLVGRLGNTEGAILNYAMSMCFLGNDFLPHGLSQKMSDEGHEVIMEILRAAFMEGKFLLNPDTTWNIEGIRYVLERLALTEESNINRSLQKKLSHNPKLDAETSPDFYPAEKVEYNFFEEVRPPQHKRILRRNWPRVYYENYVESGGAHLLTARAAAKHYFEGLHWIRAYYLGSDIPRSNDWFYPFFLPPLWSDLLKAVDTSFIASAGRANDVTVPIPRPQEQLALVLPMESWWLIRDNTLRQLPYKAPQYWPVQYTLFSCGKKWMWECEAQIPLFTLRSLRRFIPL